MENQKEISSKKTPFAVLLLTIAVFFFLAGLFNIFLYSGSLYSLSIYFTAFLLSFVFVFFLPRFFNLYPMFKSSVWPLAFFTLIVGSIILPYHIEKKIIFAKISSLDHYPGMTSILQEGGILPNPFSGGASGRGRQMWVTGSLPISITENDILSFYKNQYERLGWKVKYTKTIPEQVEYDRLSATKGNFVSNVSIWYRRGPFISSREDVMSEDALNKGAPPTITVFQSVSHF